jgi:hypothetical protein
VVLSRIVERAQQGGIPVGAGFVHTVYKRETWLNEIEDSEELPGSYATKEVAVSAGREEAIDRKTEHVIHNEDGAISERNSYGYDPVSRPG